MKGLTYILLLSLFLSSCVEEIKPQLEETYQSELVVNSVVVPGDEYVQFFISTSVPLNSDAVPFRPVNGDAEVTLTDQNGAVNVNYVKEDDVWRTSRTYQPQPGFEFELRVELTDESKGVLPITSSTFVPYSVEFESFENTVVEELVSADRTTHNYTLDFNIGSSDEDVHYRFIAKDIATGTEIPVTTILEGTNAITRLNHMEGILINSENTIDGHVELVIQSESDLNSAEIHLYTVNSEYYRYNKSLSDAYGSHNSPFDEPVSRYSNIDDGLGLFGSFTKFVKVYDLK